MQCRIFGIASIRRYFKIDVQTLAHRTLAHQNGKRSSASLLSPSSCFSAGQRLTPHSRGRINKKLELHYDYDVKGMILTYYSVSQMYDLVLLGDRLDSVIGYNSVILPPDR